MGRHRLTLGLAVGAGLSAAALVTTSCTPPAAEPEGSTSSASAPSGSLSTAASGISSTAQPGTSSTPPVTEPEIDPANRAEVQTLTCDAPIDEVASVDEVSNDPLATDVMALAGGGPGKPDQPIKWYDGHVYQGMHFIKVGLAVHRGAEFTLAVPSSWQERMRIGWGNDDGYTLANTLKVSGCLPEADGAQWLVFPGGFWLEESGCVPLDITTSGRTQSIHVPVGERCP